MSVLSKVARATECVDDAEFWQIPSGFRYALYASVPGSGPADIDPVAMLRDASKQGEALGVNMGWALLAQTGRGIGQAELVEKQSRLQLHGALRQIPRHLRSCSINTRLEC